MFFLLIATALVSFTASAHAAPYDIPTDPQVFEFAPRWPELRSLDVVEPGSLLSSDAEIDLFARPALAPAVTLAIETECRRPTEAARASLAAARAQVR